MSETPEEYVNKVRRVMTPPRPEPTLEEVLAQIEKQTGVKYAPVQPKEES